MDFVRDIWFDGTHTLPARLVPNSNSYPPRAHVLSLSHSSSVYFFFIYFFHSGCKGNAIDCLFTFFFSFFLSFQWQSIALQPQSSGSLRISHSETFDSLRVAVTNVISWFRNDVRVCGQDSQNQFQILDISYNFRISCEFDPIEIISRFDCGTFIGS